MLYLVAPKCNGGILALTSYLVSTALPFGHDTIAQFAITINNNVCMHIRVPNMLMRNPMHDVIGICNSEAHY